jgi:hypothetical protein
MGPEGSLPHLQEPASCPYTEPDQSSPCPHIPPPKDPSQYYPPIYAWVFQVVFVQVYRNRNNITRLRTFKRLNNSFIIILSRF